MVFLSSSFGSRYILKNVVQNNFPKYIYECASLTVNFARSHTVTIICSDRQTDFSEAIDRSHFSFTNVLKESSPN